MKMPTVNSFSDTPVRHDQYSTTKTSLLHRPRKKSIKKVSRMCMEEKMFTSSKAEFLEDQSMDAGFDSNTDSDVSVITVDEMNNTSTACKDHLSYKRDREGEMVTSRENISTPEFIEVGTKAVSSTPNQEPLNTSRLKRNVASQTILTLNAREFEEYDESMKSYIIEVPDEMSDSVVSISQISRCNMDTSSPLRSFYTSKLTNLYSPGEHKTTNTRKLSLRSKTMITSALERSKDVFPRYKSLEEKRLISNTFSLLPHPKTPPSCFDKVVHNPFEADLSERLGKSIFSPDVFENVLSPSEDSESIRWTIEDISSINPVAIEEDFTLPSDDEDPERESQAQQEIERYFSETHYVLSPGDEIHQVEDVVQSKKFKNHMRAAASTPQKAGSVEFTSCSTQTVLSLPEILPNTLEDSLRNLFKLFETDEFNISASNLRRKLFFHSEDEPPSPVRFEIHSSPGSWVSDDSPCAVGRRERHFTPLANQGAFSSPELSPVVPEFVGVKINNSSSCKKTLHHYFTDNGLKAEEENGDLFEGELGNSTVIMHSIGGIGEIVMESESNSAASSVLPSSQDTGYHTEESWQHCHVFSMMASTPTHHVD